jgi:hypothetical protein
MEAAMNKLTFKTIAITGLAAIAVMQASAGILIDQRLTTVMLNDERNISSKPVPAYECVTWSIFDGRKVRYALVETGAKGCTVRSFWEVLS